MLISLGLGCTALIISGALLISEATSLAFGLYVFLVGINFLVLLVYAIIIASLGSAKGEVDSELARDKGFVSKYGFQQFLVLVPFAILLIMLLQEIIRLT